MLNFLGGMALMYIIMRIARRFEIEIEVDDDKETP